MQPNGHYLTRKSFSARLFFLYHEPMNKTPTCYCEKCEAPLYEETCHAIPVPCGYEDYTLEPACQRCYDRYTNAPDLKTDS